MTSGIGSSTSTPRVLTDPAGPSALTTTSTPGLPEASPVALYQTFGASIFPTGPLGLRTPQSPEDTAVILAQAALAIDQASKEASQNRIANATGGARSGIGAAIADLVTANTNLVVKKNEKATAETDLQTAKTKEASLVQKVNGLNDRIADLDRQIAAAQGAEKPDQDKIAALKSQRQQAVSDRNAANGDLATVRGQIGDLETKIAALTVVIAGLEVAVAQSGIALVNAYSQVAMLVQDASGQRAQETAQSTNLDLRLDEVNDLVQAFQQNTLSRDDAETLEKDRQVEDAVSRRVIEAALGLVAGLAAVLDVLKQVETGPALNTREAAIASGSRFQLAL